MKCLILLTLFVFANGDINTEKEVLVATAENWNEIVNTQTTVLVEFYAPWCGHCKALEPEYAKAAEILKKEDSQILLAKVDATVQTELAKNFSVESFPTIKFFKNGEVEPYTGGRTAEEIVEWLKKHVGPPATTLDSAAAVKEFTDKREVAVLGFFTNKESDLAKVFLKAAEAYDDIDFGISTPANSGDLAVTEDKIVLVKKFDDLRADYKEAADMDKIIKFIDKESLPVVTEFTDEAASKVFNNDIKTHLLLFVSKKADNFKNILDTFTEGAKKLRGSVLAIYINIDKKENERLFDFFHVKAENAPLLRLVNVEEGIKKYKPESTDITLESIEKYFKSYLDGKLEEFIMSEEIPEDWDKNPVKVLVGKNFKAVAQSAKKNVFVEFYAPWCGHCKKLAPIWDQLGEKYKDSADVIIAKIDATANEVPGHQVPGYPTIMFFPKEGDAITYNGGHTLENLIKFVDSLGKVHEGGNEEQPPPEGGEDEIPEGGEEGIPADSEGNPLDGKEFPKGEPGKCGGGGVPEPSFPEDDVPEDVHDLPPEGTEEAPKDEL